MLIYLVRFVMRIKEKNVTLFINKDKILFYHLYVQTIGVEG
jgi:hypothetical protein